MKPPTNVIPLAPSERGVCGVCDGRYKIKNTETVRAECDLVYVDKVTNLKAGRCCAEALAFTDHMLTIHGPKSGICHPEPPATHA